jgi:hypothetical protein
VPSKAEAIGSKGIGFDNFGAGLQVFVMDAANQIGLGEIQFVVATVDEDALGIEKGSHRAVAQDGGLLNAGKKVRCHILAQNTGSALVGAWRIVVGWDM